MNGPRVDKWLWHHPHHDGSALYVSNPYPALGDRVDVYLRVPRATPVTAVLLRTYIDGEQSLNAGELDREDTCDRWYRGVVTMYNPVVNYRWLLQSGPAGYRWLNGTGVHDRDVTDAADFRLTTHPRPPAWAEDAILYQVFPDRFARSARADTRDTPRWAIPQHWDDPVVGRGPETPYQLYGGDLDGITEHLDHIQALGANTVYLTPVFPAQSNHRYDASSFDQVDPVLGGDEALARLTAAAHARGMRVMGDITTNHCGDAHEWFRTAITDETSEEAGFFLFHTHPTDYVAWFDYPSLPKFDHRNPELRRRLYEGPDSVVARWLTAPTGLDGWRIDVANMTGRHGTVDLNHKVATTVRHTMATAHPDALLIAEHSHDASADLLGDGWHGVMNYAAFTRPLWQWLTPEAPVEFTPGPFTVIPRLPGTAVAATMRDFAAAVPWRATATALNLVGSHDTARIADTLDDDEDTLHVAFGLLAAMPGIPMIYAGDEIGQHGTNGEDGRRPFPWNHDNLWNRDVLESVTTKITQRQSHQALRTGGLRWVSITDDALTFLRETQDGSVLVHATRAATDPLMLPAAYFGSHLTGLTGTADLVADGAALLLPGAGPRFSWWQLP
ncbi:glycoside hydrolase family 13 protein [Nakamurella deserti]|uniref:glycoside hydrolase family 13 protein n=1 Tax=Nakamurella deserti TaxID=2164074 RepID=UPI00197B3230|nr:glycoside hydrolase family 13 protein [Nakamurella deserti]